MGVAEAGRMYSRNHCFTRMPINADDKAATRLTNQRELIIMADNGAENGITSVARVSPFNFEEISVSNLTAASCGFWESH